MDASSCQWDELHRIESQLRVIVTGRGKHLQGRVLRCLRSGRRRSKQRWTWLQTGRIGDCKQNQVASFSKEKDGGCMRSPLKQPTAPATLQNLEQVSIGFVQIPSSSFPVYNADVHGESQDIREEHSNINVSLSIRSQGILEDLKQRKRDDCLSVQNDKDAGPSQSIERLIPSPMFRSLSKQMTPKSSALIFPDRQVYTRAGHNHQRLPRSDAVQVSMELDRGGCEVEVCKDMDELEQVLTLNQAAAAPQLSESSEASRLRPLPPRTDSNFREGSAINKGVKGQHGIHKDRIRLSANKIAPVAPDSAATAVLLEGVLPIESVEPRCTVPPKQ